jgi:uncharacterized membrane protein YhhN
MNKKNIIWLYFFLLAGLLDLIFVLQDAQDLRFFTKPLIVFCLLVYFLRLTRGIKNTILRSSISAALIFSILGDILLLFPELFLFGLGAFFMAHLSYIIGFKFLQDKAFSIDQVNFIKQFFYNLPIYLLVAVLYFLIQPQLHELKIPVILYIMIIVTMVSTARERFQKTNVESFWLVFIGAILFMISDAILALNMFYQTFSESGILVMGTYMIAQLLIVLGVRSHLVNIKK